MEAETVVFMFDISDEQIKQQAMKAVWKFSGVTFVDVREIGRLKIRGIFEQIEMGSKLLKIDNSVVIIHETENHVPAYSSFLQNIEVFKFKNLSENILRRANTVIWEFPGVTSVEVKGDHQLQVMGEFNNVVMGVKLKEVDKSVTIVKVGANVEAPPQKNFGYRKSFSATSRGQPEEEIQNKPLFGAAGARARALEAAEKAKADTPINLKAMGKANAYDQYWLPHQQKVAFGAQNNPRPLIKNQQQEKGFIAKLFDNEKPEKAGGFRTSQKARHFFPINKQKADKPEGEKTQARTSGSSSLSWNPSQSNPSTSFGSSSQSNPSTNFGSSSQSNQPTSFGKNPYQSLIGTSGSTQSPTSTQTSRKESATEKVRKGQSKESK